MEKNKARGIKKPKDRKPPLTAPEAKRGDWEVAEIHTSPSDMEGASSMSTSGGAASCLDPALHCPGWVLPLASRVLKKENKLLYTWGFFDDYNLYIAANQVPVHLNPLHVPHCCSITSEVEVFLQSEISLESNSSGLSLTNRNGLTSPPITR